MVASALEIVISNDEGSEVLTAVAPENESLAELDGIVYAAPTSTASSLSPPDEGGSVDSVAVWGWSPYLSLGSSPPAAEKVMAEAMIPAAVTIASGSAERDIRALSKRAARAAASRTLGMLGAP